MNRRVPIALSLAVVLAALAPAALGQTGEPRAAERWTMVPDRARDEPPPASRIARGAERSPPSFRGGPAPGPDTAELVLAPWRNALVPLSVALERVWRRPLGLVITTVERIVTRETDD